MRVHLSCFGLLPTASSRRPVKRYNLLVPDIFPRTEPPFQDKVDSSIDRKIKKLADYLDKNPHRGPKVQRASAVTMNLQHPGLCSKTAVKACRVFTIDVSTRCQGDLQGRSKKSSEHNALDMSSLLCGPTCTCWRR